MARLWRIAVLLLAVLPLAVPAVAWSQGKPCKMRMAMDHGCCPEGAKVAAALCCDAKADAALNENRDAAGESRLLVASRALPAYVPVQREHRPDVHVPRSAFIAILLPVPILRT